MLRNIDMKTFYCNMWHLKYMFRSVCICLQNKGVFLQQNKIRATNKCKLLKHVFLFFLCLNDDCPWCT